MRSIRWLFIVVLVGSSVASWADFHQRNCPETDESPANNAEGAAAAINNSILSNQAQAASLRAEATNLDANVAHDQNAITALTQSVAAIDQSLAKLEKIQNQLAQSAQNLFNDAEVRTSLSQAFSGLAQEPGIDSTRAIQIIRQTLPGPKADSAVNAIQPWLALADESQKYKSGLIEQLAHAMTDNSDSALKTFFQDSQQTLVEVLIILARTRPNSMVAIGDQGSDVTSLSAQAAEKVNRAATIEAQIPGLQQSYNKAKATAQRMRAQFNQACSTEMVYRMMNLR